MERNAPRIVIVGAGVIGAAIAYFLASRHGVRATLIERDPTFARASSALSASSIRQQFTTAVNIALSRRSWRFLRDEAGSALAIDGVAPALGLTERGYLYLATEAGRDGLAARYRFQREQGVPVRWFDASELAARWPWLAVDDLAGGVWGEREEGWFDGPALHAAFLRKARALGATLRVGTAVALGRAGDRITRVQLDTGEELHADRVVVAAGAWSAPLMSSVGLAVPIAPAKRDVFVLESPAALDRAPLVIDSTGVWFRPEGQGFIAGASPRPEAGATGGDSLDAIDHTLFDEVIWPVLAARVPAFEALRVRSAWAGNYEMCTFDHNALVGLWPGVAGLAIAAGFSGHGMQHAPAVGEAMAEVCVGAGVPWLEPLSPRRWLERRPLVEGNVIG
jgi:glycine/D-amino acid oxidase-like deaminating enzyme